MDFDEACDEVERITTTLELDQRIEQLRAHVADLQPGQDGRAELLAALAGELQLAEDLDGAREAATAAIDDGGRTVHEPRCVLLAVELEAGHHDVADALLAQFLTRARAGTITVAECEWIGESLEHVGRFRDAQRWFTIPLRDINPQDVDILPPRALDGRWRVRRELELPLDAYDEACTLLRQFERTESPS